ncbi:hypothetical protein LNV23_18925 [Paucibacter sp. DJ1R-11]|uniref:hypothetical protein n=1 Tax=Paucibacter sp. DJ1R-11 TaxID=2893556 RepID=UPI0021E39612|nr:hypothetical protein [Paucibacter sp. DJ1R-11]MCV2365527.1 hypothetical protein [Paucibacter sp. DJ1R-11]
MTGPSLQTLSGACVANTWKTVLSVSGSASRLNALMLSIQDATARTVKLRITIDGVVVFDEPKAVSNTLKLIVIGQVVGGTTNSLIFQPVDAASTLLVEYQSNLTETDKVSFAYNYEVR